MPADGRDTMLQVQVPDGIEEGQQFSVQTPQGVMLVICPAGNKGGDTIGIQTTPFQNASSSQVAPAPITMTRDNGEMISLETLTPAHYAEVTKIMSQFLMSKRFCCMMPWGVCESVEETSKHYSGSAAKVDKLSLGVIAMDSTGGLGHAQLVFKGHPCDLYTPKEGEAYVQHIAVSAHARGQGVGTKLLDWCEATAKARGARTLSLHVLRGNPAKRLYERFGFVVTAENTDCVSECFSSCFIVACFGRPYGCCNPSCGSDYMVKQLA